MSVSPRDPSNRRQASTSSIASSTGGRGARTSERSHMESAVTKLLVATRQLLDALTSWSTGRITETEVSDVYVRLGNDFNSCVSAFQDLDIPMHELLSVPAQLRNCLERCLADDPSPKNLERYLPEIRNTIVSLLQGLKAKQTLYKSMKEEERRKQATAASQAILEGREEVVADPEEMQRRAIREGEQRIREEARLRALERERAVELERTRERERSSGGGLRRDAVERQASSGDGRWVPPQSLHQNQPRGLPAHPSATPTQPPSSGRSSTSSSTYGVGAGSPAAGPSPAINIGPPVNSFSSPQQSFSSPQQPHHESDRPYSTMSSSTSSSEGSQAQSLSRRSIYPSGRGPNRHGPLPDPPADAFRPARRVPSNSNSPSSSSVGTDRTLSVVGGTEEEFLTNGRQSSRSPPPPNLQSSKSYPITQVTRHSLIDPPMPTLPPEPVNPAYSPTTSNTLANASNRSSSDESRPVVRHSLTDPPSPQPQSTSIYQNFPAPPTIVTASPPMPSSESNPSLDPSPPPPPSEPLHLAPPPPPPSVASVADQTLSALRKSDTNISRRASQRYSTYQIGKIMDVGGGLGIPGTTGSPGGRKSTSRRGSDIGTLAEAGEINGGPLMGGTSPGRPSRAARAPPLPTIPAGVAGSPLRGGGFVPPSEDQGSESREGEGDVSFSSSASTSTLRPSTSSHILSQQLTPPGQSDLPLPPTISTIGADDEHSPSAPDAISVFLLHGRECKKALIPAGPTIPSIRLLFMEKFAYSPGGDEFPSIYVRDPKTEWRYEWEEGEELRDGVQLSLNIEPLDQVKQHIDTQMSSLSRKLEDLIRESVAPLSSQFATLQASNNTIQAASNRMSMSFSSGTNATTPSKPSLSPNSTSPQTDRTWKPPSITPQPTTSSSTSSSPSTSTSASTIVPTTTSTTPEHPSSSSVSPTIVSDLRTQFDEVQSLRRELGIMRQIHVDGMNTVKETFSRIRKENQRLRDVATTSLGGGRAFVNAGKVKIDLQSQDVLRKVEDLADVVEELHTDVTEKLIVPKPSLMRSLKKDINDAKDQLEDLVKTTSAAATTWRTTWSQEMENVMAEEKQLSHHLAFTVDIQADFKALKDVFDQIEVYAAHRASTPTPNSSHGHGQSSLRSRGGGIGYRPPSPNGDFNNPQSSLSSVLFEIQGAKVDPTKRLKAIENAQRMRERELAEKGSGNELSNQLSEFVDGRKLKKTGGVEETERVRERKNALALRGGVAIPASPSPSMLSPGLERNFSPSSGGMRREGSGTSEASGASSSATAAAGGGTGGESPTTAVGVEVGENGVVHGGVDAGVVVIKGEEEEGGLA